MRPRRALDIIAWAMVPLVIVWLGFITASVITAANRIGEVQRALIVQVQHQNDQQLCAQYAILLGLRQLERKLGLPTKDLVLPNVEGLPCAESSSL